ncbi:MAG: hypothetical protein AABY15_04020 [Nanoarchaeota archaeon]
MKKAEKEELNQLFLSVVRLFGKKCWICKKPFDVNESFVFHHRDYRDEEKAYSDFRLPNGQLDRLNYHRYLIPIIKIHYKEFRLVHNSHHWLGETFARAKPPQFERMVKMAREINKRRYSNKTVK